MAKKPSSQTKRVCIGPGERQRLAGLADLDTETMKAHLDRLEEILSDHPFMTEVFDHPKSNQVRDLIAPRRGAGLKKRAESLGEALHTMPWQIAADYERAGFNITGIRETLEAFLSASDEVLESYAGEKTSRRPRERVRDVHIIPAIADLFDQMCDRDGGLRKDWEHTDNQCAFVTLALECAGIPCPDAGDTQLGEEGQGRLRRILKAHDEKKRLNRARQGS